MTNGLTLNGTAWVGFGTQDARLNFSGDADAGRNGSGGVLQYHQQRGTAHHEWDADDRPGHHDSGWKGNRGAVDLAFVNQAVLEADTANVAGITLTGTTVHEA